jgi:hypothetical protein
VLLESSGMLLAYGQRAKNKIEDIIYDVVTWSWSGAEVPAAQAFFAQVPAVPFGLSLNFLCLLLSFSSCVMLLHLY